VFNGTFNTISVISWRSVCLLCLFVYSGVQQILCCVCVCTVVYNTYCVVFFASGEVYLKQNYVKLLQTTGGKTFS
jgi:hypothetical protein